MPTASFLIADMQTKLGDPSGNIFSSANLLNWLNEAQKAFALVELSSRLVDATSVQQGQAAFGIPSDCIMIEMVASRFRIPKVLRRVTPSEYETQVAACPGAVSYDPDIWTEMDGKLYVYPAYGASSASGGILTPITASQTTLFMTGASNFPLTGRMGITDSDDGNEVEEMEYGLLNKTTGVLTNCARGLAHTEAASGGVTYPANQLPLYIVYRTAPELLEVPTDTPEIPSAYHEYLELYAMYLCYMQSGETDKAKATFKQWTDVLDRVTWINSREHLSQIGLRDFETQR